MDILSSSYILYYKICDNLFSVYLLLQNSSSECRFEVEVIVKPSVIHIRTAINLHYTIHVLNYSILYFTLYTDSKQ